MTTAILTECMGEVEEAIALVDPLTIGSHSFGKTRRIERAILFVNFDQKRGDDKQIERDRRQYLPSNWDVLNYGRNQGSRVRDLAVVTRDSWDQVHCRRTRGSDAVRTAMRMIFRGTVDSFRTLPAFRRTYQRAVRDRLQQLIQLYTILLVNLSVRMAFGLVYQVVVWWCALAERLVLRICEVLTVWFDRLSSHLKIRVRRRLAPAFADLEP